MATNSELEKGKNLIKDQSTEVGFLDSAFKSLAATISTTLEDAIDNMNGLDTVAKKVAQSYNRDITNSIKKSTSGLEETIALQIKIKKGQNVEADIKKKMLALEVRRNVTLKKIIQAGKEAGVDTMELKVALAEQYDIEKANLQALEEQNDARQNSKSLLELSAEAGKGLADKIDKSGTLSKILEGNIGEVVNLSRLGELSLLAMGTAILKGSENMAKLAQTTGISKEAAFELQKSLNQSAIDSGNVAFTGEKATKAFAALSKETGLVADFGGQTLETFSMLTNKLGLAEDAAGSLATMARLQGKETEKILSDTVDTASAIAKQAGVGINVKGVLEDVASASASIKVSLGSNPELLAEAATNAALLGTNLAGVDAIANSLLDFETSIKNELAAEMLLGADINLEKARQLALTNDLAGLSEEIANQEEITASFANGNRIQQEAAAAALGLSRDALSEMVMKQQLNALSAEEFKNTYGEATYEQMQSVSAQEKLALSAGKMKDAISQIGLAFAPFLDGLAKGVSLLAESKTFLTVMGGLLAGLAARQAALAAISFATAVSKIFAGFSPLGPLGIPGCNSCSCRYGGFNSRSLICNRNS
jgi:plasmid maintenance system antidote protein VapI